MTPAISVSQLTKKYGEIDAVRGIDLEVAAGETFGFLGPNGAGKSTTIKVLCTLADPTSGSARVAGHDVVRERDTVRRNIGLVFQDTTLDSYLTGEQNLRFHADLYGVPKAAFGPRLRQVLEMIGLWDRRGGVVSKQIQAFMALTQMFVMPLFFLSGALYPLNGLPSWLTVLTRIDPLTYIVDPMRHAVSGHLSISPLALTALSPGVTWDGWLVPLGLSLAMVAAMGFVMLAIAIAEFRKTE